jgi:hypothetical protein
MLNFWKNVPRDSTQLENSSSKAPSTTDREPGISAPVWKFLARWRIGLSEIHFQFGQSLLGRRVSFTKQDSQTLVPFLSVKSTLRVGSISVSHFPQSSTCASRISASSISVTLDFIDRALRKLSPQCKQSAHRVLNLDSLFA